MPNDEFNQNLEKFKIAWETRNFEIKMFWQRSNYFLLLNTSVGVGVITAISAEDIPNRIIPLFCVIGAFVSLAWIKIGLGAKFWQTHWETVVAELQNGIGFKAINETDYFSAIKNASHVEARVKQSLGIEKVDSIPEDINCFASICIRTGLFFRLYFPCFKGGYKRNVLDKPSVSGWMHKTACFFLAIWLAAGYVSVCEYLITEPCSLCLMDSESQPAQQKLQTTTLPP